MSTATVASRRVSNPKYQAIAPRVVDYRGNRLSVGTKGCYNTVGNWVRVGVIREIKPCDANPTMYAYITISEIGTSQNARTYRCCVNGTKNVVSCS